MFFTLVPWVLRGKDWTAAYGMCYRVGMRAQAHAPAQTKPEPIQYTIRGVPAEVDQILREKAALLKQSLNQLILDELTAAAIGARRRADFSDVVGQWTADPGFDEVVAAQRQIDWDQWK